MKIKKLYFTCAILAFSLIVTGCTGDVSQTKEVSSSNGEVTNTSSSTTTTENSNTKDELKVADTASGKTLQIMAEGEKLTLDAEAKDITELERSGEYVYYTWIGAVEPVKKVYDTKKKESVGGLPNGKLSASKKVIYSCITSDKGTSTVRAFDIEKRKYYDFFSDLFLKNYQLQVTSCNFIEDSMTLQFTTKDEKGGLVSHTYSYSTEGFVETPGK